MTLAVIDALNRAWDDIQRRNVAVPGVTIWVMSGHGGTQCGSILWDGAPILLVDEEVLSRGAAAVFGWLLHQAAHELADSQRPSSHTKESQRHDAVFRGAAETLELEVEEDRPETSEWPITRVPETLAPRYTFTIHRLATALTQWHTPAAKLAMASCQCVPARRLLISPSSLTEGEIRCQICLGPFRIGAQANS
jgi:hypothetical protein